MLFFRTVFLLRGICGHLEVRFPYLRTMSEYAKRALLEQYSLPSPTISLMLSVPGSDLERKLRDRIVDLYKDGEIVGIQIHIIKKGKEIANISEGTVHYLDRRSVKPTTIFPALSLSQSVSQIAAVYACERSGIVDIQSTKVQSNWSEFGTPSSSIWTSMIPSFSSSSAPDNTTQQSARLSRSNSASVLLNAGDLTIGDLVSGDTSLLPFIPSSLPNTKFTLKSFQDWAGNSKYVANLAHDGRPSHDKATKLPWELSHLAFSWGWSLLGLVQSLSSEKSCALSNVIENDICKSHIHCDNELLLSLRERTDDAKDPVALLSIDIDRIVGGDGIDLDNLDMENTQIGNFAAMFESVPSLKGREYLMDPRLLGNSEETRSAIVPSCGLYCTARSLARLYDAAFSKSSNSPLFKNGKVQQDLIDHALNKKPFRSFTVSDDSPEGADPLGERLGLSKFEFVKISNRITTNNNNNNSNSNSNTSNNDKVQGIGQVTFGGSFVIHIIDEDITISTLINSLSMEREVTRIILEEVASDCGLQLVSEV